MYTANLIDENIREPFFDIKFFSDGRVFVGGCQDGSIQFWDLRKSVVAPVKMIRQAHNPAEVSSVNYSYMGNLLVSRSCDDTLKLWDIRSGNNCLHSAADLFSRYIIKFSSKDSSS